MENAVIYARYSSHNQTENSIEAQVKAAYDFAATKNLNIIHTYADRAKTGTNDNREEFQQMLKDSNHGNFTVVIVWKVDRFGRNREEITLNKYKLKKNGVRLEYVAENISKEPEGVILESVLEGFAEYYSKALSQNCKRGLQNVALKGGYTGGTCPYGYKIIDGKYTVVPEAAKKIKDVFKMFNQGYRYVDIARKLDLDQRNVKVYLKNPQYYTGTYTRCGVNIPDMIPTLITKEEFDAAQERMKTYTRRKKPRKYILTGKVFCTCGKKYNGCGYDNYSYYRSTCTCGGQLNYIKKDDLEEEVFNKCIDALQSEISIDELTDKVMEKLKLKVKDLNPAKKKASLIAKKKNLLRLVEDGALPYEDLRERLIQLDAELSTCCGVSTPNIISRNQVKDYLVSMRGLITNKSALTGSLINKIIIDPKTRTLNIKFGPSHFGTD